MTCPDSGVCPIYKTLRETKNLSDAEKKALDMCQYEWVDCPLRNMYKAFRLGWMISGIISFVLGLSVGWCLFH